MTGREPWGETPSPRVVEAPPVGTRTVIETFTGDYFDYADPRAENVHVEDIAHGLAHTCRFGGQVRTFYSVAEHAVLVRQLVIDAGRPELGFAALHHDSHEAYLGDMPTPLKVTVGEAQLGLSDAIDVAVGEKLGIDARSFKEPIVKWADSLAMRQEAAALMRSGGAWSRWNALEPAEAPAHPLGLAPAAAKAAFLYAHADELEARS